VQFIDAAACAGVWFRLMALPAPSTGAVATSPSRNWAIRPAANELAGATAAAAAPLAAGLAVPLAAALADAVGLALADELAPPK
jgi:hypothetical protein